MTTKPIAKPLAAKAPRRTASNHVPLWLALGLVGALGLLIYGAVTPSPPSAFDRPDAQLPLRPANPWDPIHAM
jgi:hypothetical protein